MIPRRELVGSIAATIAMSGCFAPGGPKSRGLDIDDIEVIQHDDNISEISAETDFSVANWNPDDAFHDISVVGFREGGEIVCRHPVELGEELDSKIELDINFSCQEMPGYLTTAIKEESCDSTFFPVYRINQSDSNYTIEYVGDRRCGDSITTIPE